MFVLASAAWLIAGCNASPIEANALALSGPVDAGLTDANNGGAEPSVDIDRSNKGEPAPVGEFVGPGGAKTTFRAFAGKPLLVALWSTSLPATIGQLPTLDALAGEKQLNIVALNIDKASESGPDTVAPVWAAQKLEILRLYRDPSSAIFSAMHEPILPSTSLYDAKGKLVLKLTGYVDFSSPAIRAALAEAT